MEQVEDACVENGKFGDIFTDASERIIRTGDTCCREALGNAVTGVLRGDILIDQAERSSIIRSPGIPHAGVCTQPVTRLGKGLAIGSDGLVREADYSGRGAESALVRLAAGGLGLLHE